MKGIARGILLAAIAALVWAGVAQAVVYTEDFETGYTPGTRIATYTASWWGDNDPETDNPIVETDNGLAGTIGLGQAAKPFTWLAHTFDWSNPAITSVVLGIDLETTWIPDGQTEETYKPFDDDYLGWTVVNNSNSSGDIFGVHLEGRELRSHWMGGTKDREVVLATLPVLPELSWYRLRVTYTKTSDTSLIMEATLTELDANGNLGNLVGSGSVDTANSGTTAPNLDNFIGPMYWKEKNYTSSAGNVDNVYMEIIPEPATLGLMLGGVLLVIRPRRRR